jgi:phosphoglycerol transferase MdoB-like AlkP superfamily enzyme
LVAHVKEIARAVRSLSEDGRISAAELLQVKTFHRLRAAQPTDDADFGIARGTNVILIQVEGMQRWVVGTRYAGQEITPFLNRLRDSSLFFDNVFDETGDSSTSDCEYMVLNSQYPLSQGSVAFRRDANHFVTLAHAFKEASYSSFAGHAYAAGMWNRAVLYPKYGFDAAAFQPEFGAGPKLGWGIGDKPFFERAVPMLRGLPQPFLAMLITLTSHTPYQYIPASEQRLKLGPIEGTSLAGYLQSMRYVDEALALFVEKLRASALLENTTLVIYGDHESRMGFPPAWGRALDLPPETVRRLATRDLATRKIPLFVVLPERLRVAPRLINTIGGQVDIGPTVQHLMGRAAPLSFIGQSLLPEHAGHALRIDGSAVNAEHLFNSHAGGRCETFGDWRAEARAACGDLERSTREELAISWRVTLLDLAGEISGKRPAKALAKR